MSHEELLLFMEDVEQDGGIDENEGELLRNALEFRDLTAAEIFDPSNRLGGRGHRRKP